MVYRIDHNFGIEPGFYDTFDEACAAIVAAAGRSLNGSPVVRGENGEWFVYPSEAHASRGDSAAIGMITEQAKSN